MYERVATLLVDTLWLYCIAGLFFVIAFATARIKSACPGKLSSITSLNQRSWKRHANRQYLSSRSLRHSPERGRSVSNFHTEGYAVGAGSISSLSDEACNELGEIAPVMQPFVIDWAASSRVGSSFNAKDWALLVYF